MSHSDFISIIIIFGIFVLGCIYTFYIDRPPSIKRLRKKMSLMLKDIKETKAKLNKLINLNRKHMEKFNKEVKIVPPDGYEIDKENSTLECIKFKPKVVKWRENSEGIVIGHYISTNSEIVPCNGKNVVGNHNLFATKKQAKSALAMARISQIMANDERFGGPISDAEWKNSNLRKYVIYRNHNEIMCSSVSDSYEFLAFRTLNQRDLFLKENEDLVKDYLMLD